MSTLSRDSRPLDSGWPLSKSWRHREDGLVWRVPSHGSQILSRPFCNFPCMSIIINNNKQENIPYLKARQWPHFDMAWPLIKQEANILVPIKWQREWLWEIGFEHVDWYFKFFFSFWLSSCLVEWKQTKRTQQQRVCLVSQLIDCSIMDAKDYNWICDDNRLLTTGTTNFGQPNVSHCAASLYIDEWKNLMLLRFSPRV